MIRRLLVTVAVASTLGLVGAGTAHAWPLYGGGVAPRAVPVQSVEVVQTVEVPARAPAPW